MNLLLDYLYNIFIMPIQIIVETIFFAIYRFFPDMPGICIVFVSLMVSTMVLPLYKRADAVQEAERNKVKKMKRWSDHIKATFKGDERYMMQTAYYRIEGYKPLSAIAGSLSLLFQIPFFIAAYNFLSKLELLDGSSFLMITDLGSPDGIIRLGAFSVNLLPILMTAVNILSGVIYTKGFSIKDKLQLYGVALVFLVLLYNSPSGLVLYWTCNNIYSLGKNIFAKYIKNPGKVISIILPILGSGMFMALLLTGRMTLRRHFLIAGLVAVISFVPLFVRLISNSKKYAEYRDKISKKYKHLSDKDRNKIFILGIIFLTIFLGGLIPSVVVNASPTEIAFDRSSNPIGLIFNTLSIFVGFFCVWIGIFYAISKTKVKELFAYTLIFVSGIVLLDYYVFYGKFGSMTNGLLFHKVPEFNDISKVINVLAILVIIVAQFLFARYIKKGIGFVYGILITMSVVLTMVNIINTGKTLKQENYYDRVHAEEYEAFIPISREGKNVIVLMLDRGMNEYVPYIFNEKPELAASFTDFVYYPNTVSYGGITNIATPALFGGYEYTPLKVNERVDESLEKKQNEALSVMPVILNNEGYRVTVCDPPYAGYKEIPDTTIYDDYEGINCTLTESRYNEGALKKYEDNAKQIQKRNFFVYSFFRTLPVTIQNVVYDNGNYLGKNLGNAAYPYFLSSYSVLEGLDKLCYIEDEECNTFLMMDNNATHEPYMLKTPEYELSSKPDVLPYSEERLAPYTIDGNELRMDNENAVSHYHVNMISYLAIANFLDYLRANDCYDNTRIIIVSDHGKELDQLNNRLLANGEDIEKYEALLFVKDFADSEKNNDLPKLGQAEAIYVDETFMTNADVPTMALEDIVDNPVNPFSGKAIVNDYKYKEPVMINTTCDYNVYTSDSNLLPTKGYDWLRVKPGDIKNIENWEIVPDSEQ